VFIADSKIDVMEIETTLNKCGYATLADGSTLTIFRNPINEDSVSVEIECAVNEFYKYEDFELASIRTIIPDPQMIYLQFRDQELAGEVSRILLTNYDMIFDDDFGSITYQGKPLVFERET
jgi:hypothetical protein